MQNEMNLRLPKTDSATGRGLKTAVQALFGFILGLGLAIWQVPGVPEAIATYTQDNLDDVVLTIGVPVALSSGLLSFVYNWLFRKSVRTY